MILKTVPSYPWRRCRSITADQVGAAAPLVRLIKILLSCCSFDLNSGARLFSVRAFAGYERTISAANQVWLLCRGQTWKVKRGGGLEKHLQLGRRSPIGKVSELR